MSSGADCYTESDLGETSIDRLVDYDVESHNSRKEISKIVDTLVRDTTFDAFNWTEDRLNYGTLVLHRGLPYENLKFLLSQDSYFVTPEDYYTVILENMFALRYDNEDIEDCVDLLLTKYQEMRRDPETRGQWPYNRVRVKLVT